MNTDISIKVREFQRTTRVCASWVFHPGMRFPSSVLPASVGRWNGRLQQSSPSDCEHNGVSGWPIQLLQHAPLLRQAICRVVQRAGARLGIRSRSTLARLAQAAKRASFMGLRPNTRCQQRTGDDGPVDPQICHLPTGRGGVYYRPSTGNTS
jgi:hypothetical protein